MSKNNYFTKPDRRPPKSRDKGEIDTLTNDDILKTIEVTHPSVSYLTIEKYKKYQLKHKK